MAQEYIAPPVNPEPPRKRNTPLIIGIIVAVLLCCCCITLVVLYYSGDAILEWFNTFSQVVPRLL
jgi:hypothetical protein